MAAEIQTVTIIATVSVAFMILFIFILNDCGMSFSFLICKDITRMSNTQTGED